MTKLITNKFYNSMISLCESSEKSIKLCAPYIKNEIMEDIIRVKQKNTSFDIITKVNLRDFHVKASDLDAIQQIITTGGNAFNCSNLHAKLYIFDDSQCIVTSANLTSNGLKNNMECGVITNDAGIVSSALGYYDYIIAREDVTKITERIIREMASLLKRLPPVPRVQYPSPDLSVIPDKNVLAITQGLSGWKKDVFILLGSFDEIFTSSEVRLMAHQLQMKYPRNNNREAKVRQILQQLRDLGLVEFSEPGVYRKLWVW
ncbi:MAG: phospholipase D-like domain-containing protein [Firmicutes bacterium]|nr:phospholipase D-like domain-containing protein [Bacillota bacterium]